MPAEFRNIRVQSDLSKQGGDFGSQPTRGDCFFLGGVAQNIPHLFLHAPAMPLGAALYAQLNPCFEIANH